MRDCLEKCKKTNKACKQKECRMWINYKEEYNCTLETVERCGQLTLREIADRLGISFVRVKQIEDKALKKIKKKAKNKSIYLE